MQTEKHLIMQPPPSSHNFLSVRYIYRPQHPTHPTPSNCVVMQNPSHEEPQYPILYCFTVQQCCGTESITLTDEEKAEMNSCKVQTGKRTAIQHLMSGSGHNM
jgi:hypothetical protein